MPELPEVTTIVNDLKKTILGWAIEDIQIHGTNVNIDPTVKGKTVKDVRRVAKNIIIDLGEQNLVVHLAMTGQLLLRSPTYKGTDRYLKALLVLQKEQKRVHLKFCNKRGWAKIDTINEKDLEEFKQKYGVDPLENNLTSSKLLELIKSKNTNIKNILMDQKILAGIGNAYATEALWMAKIHPEARTQNITKDQAEKLLEATRKILNQGIQNRGLSISDYLDIFGKPGKQQEHLHVYRQENCPECGKKLAFKKINGRGTYFCENCQK